MSTTEFVYLDANRVHVSSEHGLFICDASEVNRYHCGVWNNNVMCFVPKPNEDEESYPLYDDHSGKHFDHCTICGVATNGNRYCGPSCEEVDNDEDRDYEGFPV